jgi:putative iron-regulated protein
MRAGACLTSMLLAACASASKPSDPTAQVVHQYAVDLDANYTDSITEVEALDAAVKTFVAAPSAAGLIACQQAWLTAHKWYSQGEYSRFYGGPIDQLQGAMNEWPIDESLIDYTVATPDGGVVNNPTQYPDITPPVLATLDENGGQENLSTGFHAIEFLLWGERPDQSQGPGTRPYTDYVDGGTAANQDRRRTYLQVATGLLLSDVRETDADWDLTNPMSYGSQFVADPQNALTEIYRGFSQMAISELLYERMNDAFVSKDQKDEESCFSESTINDLVNNALGIENVYLGHYQTLAGSMLEGPSVSSLVQAKNPTLDAQLRQQIHAARTAIEAIPPPFDHDCLAPTSSPANMAVATAVGALQTLQPMLDQGAQVLGVVNNL